MKTLLLLLILLSGCTVVHYHFHVAVEEKIKPSKPEIIWNYGWGNYGEGWWITPSPYRPYKEYDEGNWKKLVPNVPYMPTYPWEDGLTLLPGVISIDTAGILLTDSTTFKFFEGSKDCQPKKK